MYEVQTDTVKVTDFGIARVTDASRTRTGMVLGTPSFMSPEQIAGKKVDGRSDLYSLGVMAFQMLAGVLPYRAESMAELMFKIANEPAPDLRTLRPDIAPDLAAAVAKALAKSLDERYSRGRDMAEDFRRCASATPAAFAGGVNGGDVFDETQPLDRGGFESTEVLPQSRQSNPERPA
jgi:serine/threonine protein kinase